MSVALGQPVDPCVLPTNTAYDELASGLTDGATPLLVRRQQFHLRLQQADLGLTLVGWSINSSTDVISLRAKRAA